MHLQYFNSEILYETWDNCIKDSSLGFHGNAYIFLLALSYDKNVSFSSFILWGSYIAKGL